MRKGWPAGKLHADYGASARNAASAPGQYYPVRENYMLSGFVTGAWNLRDTGPGVGGFCVIPGSHKSSFRIPERIYDATRTPAM